MLIEGKGHIANSRRGQELQPQYDSHGDVILVASRFLLVSVASLIIYV